LRLEPTRTLASTFEHQLARAAQGGCHRLFQQRQPALHHGHPVARHGDHGPAIIQAHQLGLLGEQHPGGGKLEARQDLLPELLQVGLWAYVCGFTSRWGFCTFSTC
jgi:hypothetical protein